MADTPYDPDRPLPFRLPDRPPVRRIRQPGADLPAGRTQPMAGFEDRFTDIVDYIVRITDEIWRDRAIGYVRDTYDPDCVVYTSYGIIRGAETVVRNTIRGVAAVPDGVATHLNVAWSGDEAESFYTAHLGTGQGTNAAPTAYGPATHRGYMIHFAADCVSRANMIHTEWLVRDNGAFVRQIGYDLDEAARAVAAIPIKEPYVIDSQPAPRPAAAQGSVQAWVEDLFETIWNGRRLDRLARFYAHDVIVHSGGGRSLHGVAALSDLIVGLLASMPDGVMRVEHVSWSQEGDGVIVAVRWVLVGSSAQGGLLGSQWPEGKPVYMMGCSHLRLQGPLVAEEWTVFDEVAVLAMAYRG
jgi:hypothetical protein